MTYDCAWKLDQGRDVRLEMSMIKAYATEMAYEVVDHAMQTFGAMGMTTRAAAAADGGQAAHHAHLRGADRGAQMGGGPQSLGRTAMKSKYGDVSVALDGHVAMLEVDRPPNNHVSVDLMRDLADALVDLDGENDCRASRAGDRRARSSAAAPTWSTPASAAQSGVRSRGERQPALRRGGAAVLEQEADRGRGAGRGGGRGPGPGAGGRLPRRRARGALRRQLRQAGLPSRASASPTRCRG